MQSSLNTIIDFYHAFCLLFIDMDRNKHAQTLSSVNANTFISCVCVCVYANDHWRIAARKKIAKHFFFLQFDMLAFSLFLSHPL